MEKNTKKKTFMIIAGIAVILVLIAFGITKRNNSLAEQKEDKESIVMEQKENETSSESSTDEMVTEENKESNQDISNSEKSTEINGNDTDNNMDKDKEEVTTEDKIEDKTEDKAEDKTEDQEVTTKSEEVQEITANINRIGFDIGHGGKDPGMIVKDGTKEKDINLSIGKFIQENTKEHKEKEIYFLRDTDVFISKEEKLGKVKAGDTVIIIHCEISPDTNEKGIRVLYNDEESSKLANEIYDNLCKDIEVSGKVEKADAQEFWTGTEYQTIYVSVGFLTNEDDLSKLKNTQYQKSIAESISKTILSLQ